MAELRRVRDLRLLDAVDAFEREPFAAPVWRVVREGRDPTLGAPSLSRWCNGAFDVLYTSLERSGAVAEIHSLLSMQPVFPSKVRFHAHRLTVTAQRAIRFADSVDARDARRRGAPISRARVRENAGDCRRRPFSRIRRPCRAQRTMGMPRRDPVHRSNSARQHPDRRDRARAGRLGCLAQARARVTAPPRVPAERGAPLWARAKSRDPRCRTTRWSGARFESTPRHQLGIDYQSRRPRH